MKIIDLLNKIANGEEVPKKIRFNNTNWNRIYGEKNIYYISDNDCDLFLYFFRENLTFTLNDEVEIIEEEKKIPEKLKIEQDGQTYNNFYIVNQNGTKCYLTKHSKMIVETLNQVIDYLKSKGE